MFILAKDDSALICPLVHTLFNPPGTHKACESQPVVCAHMLVKKQEHFKPYTLTQQTFCLLLTSFLLFAH